MLKNVAAVAASSLALGLAACGSDDNGAAGSGGASGEYGTGLELGDEVLGSAPVHASVEPWYLWNNETCTFEETDDHPANYKAELRPVTGGDDRIGYMHYGDSDPFGVANSESIKAVAEQAEMPLDVYNLKYPSRTEPLAAARNAITKQNVGAIQANLDTSVLNGYFEVLEGEGCIPSIQMYLPIDGHPAMGNHWPDVGTEIGKYIAAEGEARGWDPENTAVVQCTDPDNGPTVNVMFKEIPKSLAAEGFEVPEGNVFDVVCRLSESQAGYKRVVDWFTGNPDFDHVAFTANDSVRAGDMARAVEAEGRPKEDTIVAAGADDENARARVREGTQDMSIAFFGERFGEWLVPMLQDIMAGNPVPSFVGTELVQLTQENVDEHYADAE